MIRTRSACASRISSHMQASLEAWLRRQGVVTFYWDPCSHWDTDEAICGLTAINDAKKLCHI